MKTARAEQATVSVVIPVHNGENYIAQAIESALTQDLAPAEVLVVDDASTDRTVDIAQSYGKSVTYLRIDKQPTGIAVMNVGLKLLRGKYLSVLHHDDYFLPGKLRRHVELMEADPEIGLSYSALWFVGPGGEPLARLHSRVRHGDYVVDGDVELHYLAVQNHLHFGNVLMRRSALESVEPFDDRLMLTSEWGTWLRFTLRYRVGYIDDLLFCYRLHPAAQTFTRSHDTGEWERQASAVVTEFFALSDLPPAAQARQDLAHASVDLTVGLLRVIRREWRGAAVSFRRAARATGWRRVPDLIHSTAIGPRLASRARMLVANRAAHARDDPRHQPTLGVDVERRRCPSCGGISGYAAQRWRRLVARKPLESLPMRCIACGATWKSKAGRARSG